MVPGPVPCLIGNARIHDRKIPGKILFGGNLIARNLFTDCRRAGGGSATGAGVTAGIDRHAFRQIISGVRAGVILVEPDPSIACANPAPGAITRASDG